jgi:hypothetical protein
MRALRLLVAHASDSHQRRGVAVHARLKRVGAGSDSRGGQNGGHRIFETSLVCGRRTDEHMLFCIPAHSPSRFGSPSLKTLGQRDVCHLDHPSGLGLCGRLVGLNRQRGRSRLATGTSSSLRRSLRLLLSVRAHAHDCCCQQKYRWFQSEASLAGQILAPRGPHQARGCARFLDATAQAALQTSAYARLK